MFALPDAPFGYQSITKSASQDVTNATNTDDTELQFATVAAGIYAVEFSLIVSGNNATGDYAYRFAVSAGTMDGRGTQMSLTTADAIQSAIITAAAAANTGTTSVGTAADQGLPIAVRVWFAFRQNTSAGIFKLQFGNAAAAAGRTSRTFQGSWMRYAQIG